MNLPSKRIDKTEYILGRSQPEYQRLNVQGKIWENITLRVLSDAGLQRGMRCLDVGCGTGSVMDLMGNMVGKTGSVTGFDVDEVAGNFAVNALNQQGVSNYFFEKGNIDELENLPGAPYDFIYSRFLLIHLDDAQLSIKKMYKALKPGGVLLLQDYDLSTIHFSDDSIKLDSYFRELLIDTFKSLGKDPRIGIRLTEYIKKATGKEASGHDSSCMITSLRETLSMMKSVFENMLPVMKKSGLADESDLDFFLRNSERAIAEHGHTTGFWPVLGSAWIKRMIDPAYFRETIIHKRFNEL